jgi:prolyl 4-hydroxylase
MNKIKIKIKINLPPTAIKLHDTLQIWEIPDFASPEDCQNIIQEGMNKGFQKSEVDDKNNSFTQSRTSTTAFMTAKNAPVSQKYAHKIQKIIGNDYPLEGIQVQQYQSGQKYNPHYDTFDKKDGPDQRQWTGMIYLNDVEKGGTTFFPKVNLRLKPTRGSLILWNNLNNNNCREPDTLHTGEAVIKGEKFISTYWFRKKKNSTCPQGIEGFGTDHYIKNNENNENNKDESLNLIEKFHNLSNENKCGCVIGIIIIGVIFILFLFFIYNNIYRSN